MVQENHAGEPRLYPGETLETIGGFPTICHYQSPTAEDTNSRPLIVCIPGGVHLARIFYGGHHKYRKEDFLTHWLNKAGFGVLSLSYPLDTNPPVMPATGSEFRIADWGRQAALSAQSCIDRHSLPTRSVVLVSWSMGGRMIVQFNIACKKLGLDVQQYISLAATPGISGIRSLQDMTCSAAGYFDIASRIGAFCKQLDAVDKANNERSIIPREIYLREYVGGTPINLIGLRLKYDGQGSFVQDEVTHEEDSRVFDIENTPYPSALYPTSSLDSGHSLTDKATWGFLLTYKLESMFEKKHLKDIEGTQKWDKLRALFHEAPSRMSREISGNHFFFVGENGARETADKIGALLAEGVTLQSELTSILSSAKTDGGNVQ
ncbi:hypothetical protein N7509_012791 [Penicillium cosmopolitanum]|uniref:Uncharacterized protein n=1 Tax=Penicillium cosmopolitanum TaxID=1131564 RepID=A0A9W9SCL5_9EURO|nr:uncharacterized protein N7509_012791 [Penicillium cosmopolitanum]KAJ5375905.1 hypothetical protein N7509_012791 [Penicillium cosmopolitanum]